MNPAETRAILTVSLLAAFADGSKHDREREEVRRIAQGLAEDAAIGVPGLVQDVLMKRTTLATALPALGSAESRRLAYEMAVCVCDADGVHSAAETAFLADLRRSLALDEGSAAAFVEQADAVASVPLGTPPAAVTAAASPAVDRAALDRRILDAAILNGALELLPESLSTMAIIPLQMRLVYQVGKAHGYELDAGHIKDFLATAGVGLTSQYLEQAGRKLIGGLLRSVGGRGMLGSVLGGVGRQAVSSGMSFVSTYALGQLAVRYYAGGRTFSTQMLKDTYAGLQQDARGLYGKHLPAMQERARTLDAGQVMSLVRGR